jgi:DNA-binding response OmpR family regulator
MHKLVIVDDDDEIRGLVRELAQQALPSAEFSEYHLATNALKAIETGFADLLITNCHMPDMDGPTLVKTLRDHKNTIPIIMVSGSDDARKLGEAAGIDRFVAKHSMHRELTNAIFSVLKE